MLNSDFKAKWLSALRSGEFKQCRYNLRKTADQGGGHCCIGVAAEVAGYTIIHNDILKPSETEMAVGRSPYGALGDLGLGSNDISTLVEMNDGCQATFAEIADFIEGAM